MSERTEQQPKLLSPNRELITPMDIFRGADFKVGLIISGATVSNNLDILSGGGRFYQVSSPVKVRMLNAEIVNNGAGWLEIEFRDGLWTGGRVLGPYKVDGRSERRLGYEDVAGRYFTSSIVAVVLSGWVAQPLSNDGVKINMSILLEPTNYLE